MDHTMPPISLSCRDNPRNCSSSSTDMLSGLMPRIQALIAPPSSSSSKKRHGSNDNPKSSKVIDKLTSLNHQLCDYCNEGGDLLCCDECPASFHLICSDPPLDDIPEGDWLCRRCRCIQEDQKEEEVKMLNLSNISCQSSSLSVETSSSNSSLSLVSPSTAVHATRAACRGNRSVPSPVNSIQSVKTTISAKQIARISTSDESSPKTTPNAVKSQEKPSVWKSLIKYSRRIQASEFSLPVEIIGHCIPLPGMPKAGVKDFASSLSQGCPSNSSAASTTSSTRDLIKQREVNRDPNTGLIPLPLRRCFLCNDSCMKQVLISCDFCSSLFHPDCLTPPLTVIPSPNTSWMCPLHPDYILETKVLMAPKQNKEEEASFKEVDEEATPLLSQRIKLHSSFSAKKVNHAAVQLNFLQKVKTCQEFRNDLQDTRSSSRQRMSVPQFIRNLYKTRHSLIDDLIEAADMFLDTNQPVKAFITEQPRGTKCTSVENTVGQVMENILRSIDSPKVEAVSQEDRQLFLDFLKKLEDSSTEQGRSLLDADPSQIVEKLMKLDMNAVRTLAFQRLQQISGQLKVTNFEEAKKMVDQAMPLDKAFIGEDGQKEPVVINNIQSPLRSVEEVQQQDAPNKTSVTAASRSKARALLMPGVKNSLGKRIQTAPFAMIWKTLTVGTSTASTMNLTTFSRCQFLSEKHACIFYDEDSHSYELINYSEHGTVVDGILYSLDVSRGKNVSIPFKRHASDDSFVQSKRPKRIIQRPKSQDEDFIPVSRRNGSLMPLRPTGGNTDHSSMLIKPRSLSKNKNDNAVHRVCGCLSSPASSVQGYEGPAPLKHGSIVKFGCMLFVFSIVSNAVKGSAPTTETNGKRKRTSSDSDVKNMSSSSSASTLSSLTSPPKETVF